MIIEKPINSNYQWVVLVITVVAQSTTALVVMGMSALAPFFQQDFGLTRSLVGALVISLNVGSFFSLSAAGKAVDRFGERTMILVGGALLGLTSMAIIFVHTYYAAFLIFVLAGFGLASSTPAGSKAVMSWFAERQRGMAMGIRQTGFPIGGMIGALILPILATSYGWRLALFFAGAGVILGSGICYIFYKAPPEQSAAAGRQVSSSRISSSDLLKNPSFLSLSALSFSLATVQSCFMAYLILYSTSY